MATCWPTYWSQSCSDRGEITSCRPSALTARRATSNRRLPLALGLILTVPPPLPLPPTLTLNRTPNPSPSSSPGAQRYLKPSGISIPCDYTSYVAPLSSPKLWNEVRNFDDLAHYLLPTTC